MTNSSASPTSTRDETLLTEPEARAFYLTMPGKRSISEVHRYFTEVGRTVPTERTLKQWSSDQSWVRLAAEYDERTSQAIAGQYDMTAVAKSKLYRDLAYEAALKALTGVMNLDPRQMKAHDIKALAEVAESAGKMAELLEGRATSRTESITRRELDVILTQMQQETSEHIARISTVDHHPVQ